MTPKPLFLSLFLLLASCAAVVAGTPVLAYNEQTGKNEYRPVLEQVTQGLAEKKVTHLTLRDDESGLTETLTTTKGHPFYLAKNVDGTNRPVPEGHEDLGMPWVGAGELKPGDKVRQADGTTGSVTRVQNTLETRQMYNLDVAVADTFHVGQGQWLVHNQSTLPYDIVPYGYKSSDLCNHHPSLPGGLPRIFPAMSPVKPMLLLLL